MNDEIITDERSESWQILAAVAGGSSVNLQEWLQNFERNIIIEGLIHNCGSIVETGKQLEIKRTTLTEKIRKHEINPKDYYKS